MAEVAWNWESKVEQLRQILEKQALERTYDVDQSTSSTDFFSVENVSVTSESLNSSGITTVSDEHLINLINYSDFVSFSLSSKQSLLGSMTTYRQAISPRLSFPLPPPPPTPTSTPSVSPSQSTTVISVPTNQMTINDTIGQSSPKHDVSCNTSRTSIENSSRDFCTYFEGANWISMLEMAKSDFIKLIDSHINTIRDKAEQTQSKQYEWLQALQISQARKIIARRSCVRRIRDEFTAKMTTCQNLLDQLENI